MCCNRTKAYLHPVCEVCYASLAHKSKFTVHVATPHMTPACRNLPYFCVRTVSLHQPSTPCFWHSPGPLHPQLLQHPALLGRCLAYIKRVKQGQHQASKLEQEKGCCQWCHRHWLPCHSLVADFFCGTLGLCTAGTAGTIGSTVMLSGLEHAL